MGVLEDAALAAGETKVERFNRLVVEFGNEVVASGLCPSFKIKEIKGDINLILFNGIQLGEEGLLESTHRKISEKYFELMHNCGITDEDFEKSKGGMSWEV